MIGFILLTSRLSMEPQIRVKLNELQEVKEVHPLFGEYDLIVNVEVKDFETLGRFVTEKVRTIDGVIDTKTLSGVKF